MTQRLPDIDFTKYELSNGLQVILHEDHSVPIVAVNIWYHVGSKNERPGRTGFAHLFEHMMFQGSLHSNGDYFRPLQEVGGRVNGSTNTDRTNYWEVVPTNYLNLALWMESDRMCYLLPAMTQQKFENQRDVVRNERRQSYENRPYGLAWETLLAALYPADHPYHWPVIGSMNDISSATRADVAEFFRRFYHPGNASLCIAGDFFPRDAREFVELHFGDIPARPRAATPVAPANPPATRRLVMDDRVTLPRLYLAWQTVPLFAEADADLDLLATVLGGGKSSRLYRTLIHDLQLAQDVSAQHYSSELAGAFVIQATARPGRSLDAIERAIDATLDTVLQSPPEPAELDRAQNIYEAHFIVGLESIGGFGGLSDRLNAYNTYRRDPGAYRDDFDRYLRVTETSMQAAARRFLNSNRIALEVHNAAAASAARYLLGGPPIAASAPATSLAENSDNMESCTPDRQRRHVSAPGAGPDHPLRLPPIQRAELSNGIPVLVVEHHKMPVVSVRVLMHGGRANDPAEAIGRANLFAAMLDEGTPTRSAIAIAEELAGIGASLGVNVGRDFTTLRLNTLVRHVGKALDVFGDVLLRPTFPDVELARQRSLALGRLARLRDEPTALGSLALDAVLYGAHPYGRPECGTTSCVESLTRADLASAYRDLVRPDRASIIVAGAVTLAEVVERIERLCGGWRGDRAATGTLPDAVAAGTPTIYLVDKPGSLQSVILAGEVGPKRALPDYFALVVMNVIFGGQFSSRLNLNLRERKGYTYGARSAFEWRRARGPFYVQTSVETAVTAAALTEILAEWRGIAGERPPSRDELDFAKAYVVRSYPSNFETAGDIAARLEDLVRNDLPDDYFNLAQANFANVSVDDVVRVAQANLATDPTGLVIVGDVAKIGEAVRHSSSIPVREGGFDSDYRFQCGE